MNDSINKTAPPKVGDIFVCNWGYEQTNVDFYQVTRTTDRSFFTKPIKTLSVPGSDKGGMCDMVTAAPNQFTSNTETNRRIGKLANEEIYFPIGRRQVAFRWDGKPTFRSWYA
jgi:hypothetical protein